MFLFFVFFFWGGGREVLKGRDVSHWDPAAQLASHLEKRPPIEGMGPLLCPMAQGNGLALGRGTLSLGA